MATGGICIESSLVIGQDIFNLNVVGIKKNALETVTFRDDTQSIERELVLSDSRITSVMSQGSWPELGDVYRMAREQTPLNAEQIALFRHKGILSRERTLPFRYVHDDIICNCMQVTYGRSQQLEKGEIRIKKLMDSTGAGSVCGSCIVVLKSITGF